MNTSTDGKKWHKLDLDAPSEGVERTNWKDQRFGDERIQFITDCTSHQGSNSFVMSERFCKFFLEKLLAQTRAIGIFDAYEGYNEVFAPVALENAKWWQNVEPLGWVAESVLAKPTNSADLVYIDDDSGKLILFLPESHGFTKVSIPNHGWGYMLGVPTSPDGLRFKKSAEEKYE